MKAPLPRKLWRLGRDTRTDRVVPPSGAAAWLTLLTAAAMAFLAVFALALSVATGRLADRWSEALANGATVRISAPADQMATQTQRVLDILSVTPGVETARALDPAETQALLSPWFGPDLPVESLPIPQLIDIQETPQGFDAEGLRLRLSAEVPGATLDDHQRWRRPLVAAADRMRMLGLISLALIGAAMAAMVTLAAMAALSANGQVIRTLRLIGARDGYVARAFVRRFTSRTLTGAAAGTAVAMATVALMPSAGDAGGFLTDIAFHGVEWLWPLTIPPLAAIVAFVATRTAALRSLRTVL